MRNLALVAAAAVVRAAVVRNVSYAVPVGDCDSCPSCRCMDIFLPSTAAADPGAGAAGPAGRPAPFVLFFHGGLWYSGSRDEIDEVCTAVVSRSNGTVGCATADYPYSQDLAREYSGGLQRWLKTEVERNHAAFWLSSANDEAFWFVERCIKYYVRKQRLFAGSIFHLWSPTGTNVIHVAVRGQCKRFLSDPLAQASCT